MAVSELGGSASVSEIDETVIRQEGYNAEQQNVLHGGGPRTEIVYRLAWARTNLKNIGVLANSARGIWALTDKGIELVTGPAATVEQRRDQLGRLWRTYDTDSRRPSPAEGPEELASTDGMDSGEENDWKEILLGHLLRMPPDAFERLAQRLLREADFDSVTVTGRPGDGGIDGLGVYRLGLVSFPVFFQCKRHQGTVGARDVRDFRGAMAGRGERGLLITTGSFTVDAKEEATRVNPSIDLIDGERLCDLLKRYELGIHTVTRTVEDTTVDGEFFEGL
jgi:restriction system protein